MSCYRPIAKNAFCQECQQIARELNQAFAKAYAQTKTGADALYALIGGEEEDAMRAEQLLTPYKYQNSLLTPPTPSRLSRAIRSRLQHKARTGHKLETVNTPE
jgi:hypothetical protein